VSEGVPTDLSAAAAACRAAADVAGACAQALAGGLHLPGRDLTRCLDLCRDATDLLGALATAFERPFAPARAAGVRKMIEAGMTVATEAGAECELNVEVDPLLESCGEACERCADALRGTLTTLVDHEYEEQSGAV